VTLSILGPPILRVFLQSTWFSPEFFQKRFLHPTDKFKNFAVGVFEFVPLFDNKVQEKFLEIFWGGPK
jgi:hypothetical protein